MNWRRLAAALNCSSNCSRCTCCSLLLQYQSCSRRELQYTPPPQYYISCAI
ncbi:hypothetical protein PF005_g15121 [Phytophthora fragariae]|uniref:Uncharacterized protein n=1 Tax=Phytophthora fragariae TaxID=53985 RepID=A0A6A3EJ48_9STRA|nr:hypothetical protein PF003_g12561 [Phytophthora fragariae]KAE8933552.1 hypothetical protein PF009_g16436 [Phytophthora fragariae]KAE9100580.1 hypothetical protein PF007_g15458 [Phytophthora fragariae]KAE9137219.1 hypothetical protein PF006_g14234 [Phytophthora fragariae]KAE9201033.1 hypothetical protein PF005_g15121 [Phytophthora fragariae]